MEAKKPGLQPHMVLDARKPARNKCTDQHAHPRSLISAFVIRNLSNICFLPSIHFPILILQFFLVVFNIVKPLATPLSLTLLEVTAKIQTFAIYLQYSNLSALLSHVIVNVNPDYESLDCDASNA